MTQKGPIESVLAIEICLKNTLFPAQCNFYVEIKFAKIYRAHQTVTPDKIPQTLTQRFTEEKEIDSIKKKEKQEAHLYLSVTVITDEQFNGHQGKNFFLLLRRYLDFQNEF